MRNADGADERERLNRLTEKIIGLAFKIHNKLGPGFVEKIYCEVLAFELSKAEIDFKQEAKIRVKYDSRIGISINLNKGNICLRQKFRQPLPFG